MNREEGNQRMEDWLRLINAETEGDLMAIQQTTEVPEIQDVIVMLRDLSADEQVRREAEIREKALRDEASAMSGARQEGQTETIRKMSDAMKARGMTDEEIQAVIDTAGLLT